MPVEPAPPPRRRRSVALWLACWALLSAVEFVLRKLREAVEKRITDGVTS